MTRQKKEIIKKIAELDREIANDEALSFGIHPANAYEKLEKMIDDLQEELAHLSHHESYIDMVMDQRWLAVCRPEGEELPFE